ncbi:hypothetical protein [Streptomyces sp. NPDC051569]|uniref:hypothetical protein n=1 Tax=Streptomyces sp. NPDC051569 TaxID=3365661 RepID=UPI0037A8BEE1
MTDHFPRTLRAASPVRTSALLRAVADHLAAHRPDATMTEAARLTVTLGIAGSAVAARPLLRILPFPTGSITRGEYALRLRKAAWATATAAPRPERRLIATGIIGKTRRRTITTMRTATGATGTVSSRCPVCELLFEDCTCTGLAPVSRPEGQGDVCPVREYWQCRCTPWTGSTTCTTMPLAVAR